MIIKSIYITFFIFMFFTPIVAQEVDISDPLKQIENGKSEEAMALLSQLKKTNAGDPSVIFLDATLTQDGFEAAKKYSSVIETYPACRYADASLYRLYSYYYSTGEYKKASGYLEKLKKDYPQSSYLSLTDKIIPPQEEEQIISDTVRKESNQKTKIVKTEEPAPAYQKFTIQAGAFLNADNAKRLSDQLIKDGYTSEITNKEIGGSMLKVVSAGKFSTEEAAKKALASIEAKYNLKGRVIPLSNK